MAADARICLPLWKAPQQFTLAGRPAVRKFFFTRNLCPQIRKCGKPTIVVICALLDRRRRPILGRAIGPAAAAFQYVHDATDDAPIVCPLNASHIRRHTRLNPLPLLIAQPKQVLPHGPDPPKRIKYLWNQDYFAAAAKLMSSDPSFMRLSRQTVSHFAASAGPSLAPVLSNVNSRSMLQLLVNDGMLVALNATAATPTIQRIEIASQSLKKPRCHRICISCWPH